MDPDLVTAIHESLFVDAGMGQREAITDAYTPEGQAIAFVRNINAHGYRVVPIEPFDYRLADAVLRAPCLCSGCGVPIGKGTNRRSFDGCCLACAMSTGGDA